MTTLLISIGGGLIALLVAFMQGRLSGARREREKQAAERLEARKTADKIDGDIAALSPEERRERLKQWAR